jgi:D-tyrosyl-tRNA(Tyr) deacylase
MKVVIQRVTGACVTIGGNIKSEIKRGMVILLGIENNDGDDDLLWLTNKLSHLRIFDDDSGTMNLSITDISGDMLVVSQFTLCAKTKKGNRPSYIKAAQPNIALPMYLKFISMLEVQIGKKIMTGEFGANMVLSITNSGPVTIIIDTKNRM